MEWIVLFGIMITLLLVIYGRLREALRDNEDTEKLRNAARIQEALAKRKDAEYLNNTDAGNVVGFLNRLHQDDNDN
jgi:hypothetical protein